MPEVSTLDLQQLPPRIPTSTVCNLAGYGKAALMKWIKEGCMPASVDRGRERLFRRDDVLKALGLTSQDERTPWDDALKDPWENALEKMTPGKEFISMARGRQRARSNKGKQ